MNRIPKYLIFIKDFKNVHGRPLFLTYILRVFYDFFLKKGLKTLQFMLHDKTTRLKIPRNNKEPKGTLWNLNKRQNLNNLMEF